MGLWNAWKESRKNPNSVKVLFFLSCMQWSSLSLKVITDIETLLLFMQC